MKNKILFIFAFVAWLFTVSIAFRNVLSGSIPFWYDPARDMLSAWDNLHKITLIGPTSGIPGIFYGPYWIWWLSFGELFSKDPKIVDAIVLTVPYIIGFPLVLYLFSRMFGRTTSILLWLLFFYSSQNYMIFLWNPHLAPLLFLAIIYLLVTTAYGEFRRKTFLQIFLVGILTGLALNIHISFSVGFTIGSFFFLSLLPFFSSENLKNTLGKSICLIASYLLGIVLMFAPFFLFEVRHGFHQTRTALNAFLHGGAVVALHGLTKTEIISSYFMKLGVVLQVPFWISIILLVLSIALLLILILKKKVLLTTNDIRLVSILVCITASVLGVYLVAKNPIWSYHFIGVEIVMLLLVGMIASKIKPMQYLLLLWVLVLTVFQVQGFVRSFSANRFVSSSLFTEDYIVRTIAQDAKGKVYTVYTYSPSIYSYEYSYLFRDIAGKDMSYDPGQIQRQGVIYLILPKGDQGKLIDFIHFKTPDTLYKTTKEWHIPDGTVILKREVMK